MNFSIDENEIEEKEKSGFHLNGDKMMLVIIIVVAIICGLTVFLVSNAIFGKKKPVEVVDTKVSTSDETVQILYSYVSHNNQIRNDDKLLKEKSITISDFNDEDKYYYALQFVQPEDLSFSGDYTENDEKIYILSDKKIKSYMQRFFGNNISYGREKELTYQFDFSINGRNYGVLEYSSEDNGYKVHFIELEGDDETKKLVRPCYAELYEAIRKTDNSMVIKEKIIYTELKDNDGVYELNIYKDYERTRLIEKKTNLTLDDLKKNPIQVKKYYNNAETITYTFKVENTRYYFYGSTIPN